MTAKKFRIMKEHRKFYSSLGLLIILNIIIKPVWIFLIDRQVQNLVGPSAYGVYFSLLNFSYVFFFLLDWGLSSFFNRQFAAQSIPAERIGDLLLTRLFFIFIYLFTVFGVAWFTGVSHWDILWKAAGIQVLTSLFIFLRSIVTAQQWFRTDAWLSVVDKSAMIIVCGSFLYIPSLFGGITIDRFLFVQLICTGSAFLFTTIILARNNIHFFKGKKSLIDKKTFRAALPFGIVILLMATHNKLDAFLLERMHKNGDYEAGIYAGAYRLLDASNMIGYLYASFLLPFIARQQSLKENIRQIVLNGRHLLVLFSLLIALVSVFMAPWIQHILYHNNDISAITIIQWCLPSLLGYSLVQVYGTVLTATGKIVAFNYIVLFSIIINIALNFLLIPAYGAKGCCIAALASQVFCGIVTMLYASKKCGINIDYRSLLMYIFIGIIAGGMLYLSVNSGINGWLSATGVTTIVIVMSLLTGLFKIANWNLFFKQTNTK